MSNVEIEVKLNRFRLRWYQLPVFEAIEEQGYKKVLLVAARRSGKDVLGWNLAIRQCIKKSCLVYYVLPTYSQARKAIFDCITMDGMKLIDYIPKELIESINQSEMKIRFKGTNSILQCIGGDSYDTSLIGTNPYAVIFSEYSRMVDCYPYVRPILAANGGWVLFCSTPFGKNHFYNLYQFAKDLPDWKVFIQKASEIQHIPDEILQLERMQMSPELFEQEYECSFTRGVSGSYYGTAVEQARKDGRICPVAWEPGLLTHTSWDLGVSDDCVIIWWQTNAECTGVRIIDYYANNNLGMDHYAKILQTKPYRYGYHFCPADIKVREFGAGAVTRFEKAAELGVDFTIVDQVPLVDGIDNVLANFNKLWIDETKCKRLVDALENYYREWDEERQVYKPKPVHNWASHACFVGDTKISMADGDLRIENIREGMLVKTPFGLRKVLGVHKRLANSLVNIQINKTHLICTPDHYIFTQRGLVKSDTLRYNDIVESIGRIRGWIWQKIYGLYLKENVGKGFKNIFSSLKMDSKSCLMVTFLRGMDTITEAEQTYIRPCNELYGCGIMDRFHLNTMFTTLMEILRIIQLKISNCWMHFNMGGSMRMLPDHGHNLKNVKIFYHLYAVKPLNGTEAKKGERGISSMLNIPYRLSKALDIPLNVCNAAKNSLGLWYGLNFAHLTVNKSIVRILEKMMKSALAVYAIAYFLVINIFLRKHVVKNVQMNQCVEPKWVYDLTIEHDNCYYANGYLVSNSDALRYLCLAINKTKRGMTSQEFEKAKSEALYGSRNQLPRFFNDDPRYNNYR